MFRFHALTVQILSLYILGEGNKAGIYFCKNIWKHSIDFIFIIYKNDEYKYLYEYKILKILKWI